MNDRLQKQIDFIVKIDEEKNILRQTMAEEKMMLNMHGIWQSWHICCRNMLTRKSTSAES